MNLSDFEAVWKRQELPRGAEADLAALHASFATKNRKLAATLLVRDLAEASAGIFVAVVMGFVGWKLGRTAWPVAVAVAMILGVTGFFLWERVRAHRRKLGAEATMLAKLDADIAELGHQRRLLLSLWKWYLAPLAAAIVILCLTIRAHLPAWSPAREPWFMGGYFLLMAALMVVVGWMNRQAVRRRIEPRLVELEKLRSDLLTS